MSVILSSYSHAQILGAGVFEAQWLDRAFLGNPLKDWFVAMLIVLVAVLAARTLYWFIEKYVKRVTKKPRPSWTTSSSRPLRSPSSSLVPTRRSVVCPAFSRLLRLSRRRPLA